MQIFSKSQIVRHWLICNSASLFFLGDKSIDVGGKNAVIFIFILLKASRERKREVFQGIFKVRFRRGKGGLALEVVYLTVRIVNISC